MATACIHGIMVCDKCVEVARKRITDLEWAIEYTLRFVEGMQKATPEQLQKWLDDAKLARDKSVAS